MVVAALGLAPVLAVAIGVGALGSFLQVGSLFTVRPWVPDLSRLDPIEGLRRRFSGAELGARAAAGLVGLLALALTFGCIRDALALAGRPDLTAAELVDVAGVLIGRLWWRAGLAVALAGAAALIYRRWRWWKDHHMSRREVLREQRETEGDPGAQRRRRHRRRELARGLPLKDAWATTTCVVRGNDLAVLVAWPERRQTPRVVFVLRPPGLIPPAVPSVRDDALARELGAVPVGSPAPRRVWRRLAAHLVRGES